MNETATVNNIRKPRRGLQIFSFVAAFAIIGAVYLIVSKAATPVAPQPYIGIPGTNGTTVTGNRVVFDGGVTNYVNGKLVQYYVNGQHACDAGGTIYGWICFWDSTKIADGQYNLVLRTYDLNNNPINSPARTIIVSNKPVIRGAFYYPWFPEAWNQQGLNPFTKYHPTLGFYSSADTTVINKQIDAMQFAGLNTGIFSWWGQGSKEDQRFSAVLQAASGKNFKWAPYYECEGNASGGTCSSLSPSVSKIQSDLNYIKSKYTSSDSYLKIGGKPVIFVYGDGTDNCSRADAWKQANAGIGFYVVMKVFSGYASCASQPDNWHQYGPAVAEDHQSGHSFAISPGFNKANESTPRLARDLNRWRTNIQDMVNSHEPLQLVTTFNEWGEGSAIESAQEWASNSGFGQYIDAMHSILGSTGGGTNDQAPSTPTGVAATVQGTAPNFSVVVHWNASTDSDSTPVSSYEVYRNGSPIGGVTAPQTSLTDTSVTAGTTYNYTVRAIDTAAKQSGDSTAASVTIPGTKPTDSTPPSAPGNVTATLQPAGSKTVHVSWSASTDNTGGSGLNDYVIFRDGNLTGEVKAPATSFDDTNTNYSTTYKYDVVSRDNAGNVSAASATASVTTPTPATPDTAAPDVPTATASVVSPTQVTIKWNAVQDNPKTGGASGVKGYLVFRDGTQFADVAAPSTSTNNNFTFVSNQAYKYTVLAYDVAGNKSAQSAASTVTPNPQVSTGGSICGTTAVKPATYAHVVWIWFENHPYSSIIGNANGPYWTSIAKQCATATNYSATSAPSEPNYISATSGSNWGINSDDNFAAHKLTVDNIFAQVRAKGGTAMSYQESMTSNCQASDTSLYVQKHNPAGFYVGGTDHTACLTDDVPLTQFNANALPTFAFITPNMCNDAHNCSINTADKWTQNFLPSILNSASYKAGNTLVVLMFDEATAGGGGGPVPDIFIGPSVKAGYNTSAKYNHYNLLRSTEEALGINSFLANSSSAASMRNDINF